MASEKPDENALSHVVAQNINNFYGDGYKKLVFACLLSVGAIAALIICIISAYPDTRPKPPVSFPGQGKTATDTRIIPMITVLEPNMPEAMTLQWITETIQNVMQLNSQIYLQQLSENKKYFSEAGYQQYLLLMSKIYNFESVGKTQLVMQIARPISAPIVNNEGIYKEHYSWVISLPIRVDFRGTVQNASGLNINVNAIISRKSMEEDITGLEIVEIDGQIEQRTVPGITT